MHLHCDAGVCYYQCGGFPLWSVSVLAGALALACAARAAGLS